MFDIGWSELLLIAVVALIFIGPKELPGVLRAVGQWSGKIRRMASEFQDQFREAMREAEMADLKKDIDEATGKLSSTFDPLDFNDSKEWKPAETPATPALPAAADAPPAPPAEAVMAGTAAAPSAPPAEAAMAGTAAAPPAEPELPLPAPAPAVSEKDFAPAEAPPADRSRTG